MIKAVVGANWGDEGKGKITDMLAEKADIIVRFQGGANAGHTIVNDYGKFALHTLPSGVFYNHTTSVIGNGVALNIPVFFKEYNEVVGRGVPAPKILISNRAQMVMSYHILFDQYEEERLGGKAFGSTKSGIAPFYSDKYAKIGFQVSELFDEEALKEKVVRICETKNVTLEHLYHKPLLKPEDIMNELMEYKKMVEPYVCDVSLYLWNALKEGKQVLLEGQLGTLKDPDHGIYPMVTSSSTLAAYGAIGAGLPISEPTGSMIVDIGGGTAEIAVISLGGIVASRSVRMAGDMFDQAIIAFIKRKYNLLIGERTAEQIKIEIGSAYPMESEMTLEIKGRNLVDGLPKNVIVHSEDVREALLECLVKITSAIKETLERTPPELSADIIDHGITLTGGGALLRGLDKLIESETGIDVHVAEDPLDCVAKGAGAVLDHVDVLHDVLDTDGGHM